MDIRTAIKIIEEGSHRSFLKHKKNLVNNGSIRLFRVMNMKGHDPVALIANGHHELGCCWSYDLDFLRHGDNDFGYGGEPEDWFYFDVMVDANSVDWRFTEEVFVELNNFEREIRVNGYQPLHLNGITDHWGRALDCSTILGVKLNSGPEYEH